MTGKNNDLQAGMSMSMVLLVTESRLLTDRQDRNYYSLRVNRKGGRQTAARVWSDNISSVIERGMAIEAMVKVENYKGEMQLIIQKYKAIPAENFDPGPYVRTADIDVDDAYETIFDWEKDSYSNPLLKKLMGLFHDNVDFAEKFKAAPAAAARHHNYRGGLLEHTLEVWNLASALSKSYGDRLDRELLLAGAALHDIGKIHCYRLISGISEHTENGMLVDHIFIGASMLSNLWDGGLVPPPAGIPKENARRSKNLILHLIMSHHGKRQWGATVPPKTPEAIVLHFCDQISATLQNCFDLLDNLPEGKNWTDWVEIMDESRKLFRNPQ